MVSRLIGMALALCVASLLLREATWAGLQKWGDTGTVAAVTVASRTIVVEIPRGSDSLTVGAEVLPDAILQSKGRVIDLAQIQIGDRVRIEWSRGEHGVVTHKIVVIEPAAR